MIELFDFQAQASAQIAERFRTYYDDPPWRGTARNRRKVPFYQELGAITGAGKTAIVADAIERIRPLLPVQPFVIWLSKGRVVVSQSYVNLQEGGKYRHLIESYTVHLLAEYRPEHAADGSIAHLYFATVATFNQRDKDKGDLRIFRSDLDTADHSIWEGLKERLDRQGQRRPLLIVYDEAHNLSDQQTQLLLELEPDAIIAASATPRIPPQLSRVIHDLKTEGWTNETLVTQIDPAKVALSGLIKDEMIIGGYQARMSATIDDLLADFGRLEQDAKRERAAIRPKAIYVAKTNIVDGNGNQRDDPKRPFKQRQAPPIVIWRYLVNEKKIDPKQIAVYCTLDFDKTFPPPKEFTLFKNGDKDYQDFIAGNFRHIIFNLSLQEGWDDPECYFVYVDKSMASNVQVEQLVGRALRQPHATRYDNESLNTAHFYVRVDTRTVFADVVKSVRSRLQKEAPEVNVTAYGLGGSNRPIDFEPKEERFVPKTYADSSLVQKPVARLIRELHDYSAGGQNVQGEGSRALIQQRVGDSREAQLEWVPIDHNNPVSARWIFQRAVMRLYPKALEVAGSDDAKFDAKVEIGSTAFHALERLALDVVEAYFQYVRLRQRPHNPYRVGSVRADPDKIVQFDNALHKGYAGLNPLELAFASALDASEFRWSRNPSRSGYGIPLLSVGQTSQFYPDFLVWKGDDVFALDTTGQHLMKEKAARKLLTIASAGQEKTRLFLRLISPGRWNEKVEQLAADGFTVWRLGETRELGMEYADDAASAVDCCLRADVHEALEDTSVVKV